MHFDTYFIFFLHFVGQHIKEFTEFLSKHTDTFHVVDDHVVLVGCEDMADLPARDRLHLPQTNIDTRGTQQMLDFFAQCIEMKGPIMVDQLFHLVTTNFPQEQWLRMFKTPSDLMTFLRLFSDCFHIQANLVTLLQKPKLSDSHIQQSQAKSREQYNAMNNNRNAHHQQQSSASSLSSSLSSSSQQQQPSSQPPTPISAVQQRLLSPGLRLNANATNNNNNASSQNNVSNNNNNNNNSIVSPNFKLNAPVTPHSTSAGNGDLSQTRSEPNSGFDSYIPISEMKLENLCERNYPSPQSCSSYGISSNHHHSPGTTTTMGSQPNSLNHNAPPAITLPPQAPAERLNSANQTLKQRINNLVIRTLAENYEKDKQSLANQQAGSVGYIPQNSPHNSPNHVALNNTTGHNSQNSSANAYSNSPSQNYFVGDTWKIKVLQNTSVIANIKQSMFVTEAMLKFAQQNQSIVVSLDCEGINLGVKGEITLIEIGTTRGEAFIFDVRTCPEMINDGGLKALLEHENVIKVVHDCRNDAANLYLQFGILLRNVFDTQVSQSVS